MSVEVTRHDMLKQHKAGEEMAVRLLREAGEGIGRFLGGFCNIIDPEVIVGGGEAVTFGDYLFEPMRGALKRHAMWMPPPITPDWTDDSWARGQLPSQPKGYSISKAEPEKRAALHRTRG